MQNIKQIGSILQISFEQNYESISRLIIKNEFDSISYENINGVFNIDLKEVIKVFSVYESKKIYIVIEEVAPILTTQKNLKVNNSKSSVNNLCEFTYESSSIHPYITRNGFLHLSLGEYDPKKIYFSRRHIDKVKFNNSQAYIEGQFSIFNSNLEDVKLLIKTRFTNEFKEININPVFNRKQKNSTIYDYSIDFYNELIEFIKFPFENGDVVDIYLSIKVKETLESIKIKVGNPRILVERFLKGEILTDYGNEIVSITPYFTMKGRNISFRINRYDVDSYLSYLQNLKSLNFVNRWKKESNKVWVIGEKSYKAQDNGYHFFKFMRTNFPELPVFYVIEKESPEASNVIPYGNVIFYKTKEHFDIMLKADYICSTHHPELLYPTNSEIYLEKIHAKKIFLQHGVLGTKNLTNINGNQLKDFNVDLFITSSEREKEIVVRDLKFDANQVKVTGLPRFDELFKPTKVKNQILIIPTWRDWLTSADQLENSEYLNRMNKLLSSSKLKEIVNNGTEIIFCLHPNMQPFIDMFDIPKYIKSIKQGEVDVQKLIKESKLMITDYSSVAFDFSFLEKPVIYYQFDRDRFLGIQPSHIDIENELPGIIVNSQTDLEVQLDKIIKNNYKINNKIKERANKFIEYSDQSNCFRIYSTVINYKSRNKIKSKVKYDILTQHIAKRFRKDKNYFKIMDKFNTFTTKLAPVKKDLIVFESNVGKSVSDSPKVIYDKLKEYKNDYKIVWVNNKQYPFNDPNVVSIKRLSPEYYYYLSRAKYWINNQNFPYYINKAKNTTYIQTWHGTPLKKMLNDVAVFEGRDENYKNRVNQAVKYWDYLISPSPYASECFKSAFEFKKEILEIGYPRNDVFYNQSSSNIEDRKKIIKQKLGIQDDRKIILYAPTFRDDEINKAKKHIINLQLDLNKLKESIGNEYILILRPHIIISNAMKLDESLADFVIDGNKYDEISDLYLITDICITDYSSVMFDFANSKKPLLFFTYDLDYYKNQLRGFYFDFENKAPGPLLKTNEQLIEAIKNIDKVKKDYKWKYDQFYKQYCTFETGNAAKTIVEKFFV
ncbi:CDP-glycerol glycerophosphotransferase family protein [Staphylococcus pasteuri]|uniref:CDP-glycerol glycerophosphotransferase family protein n=1 Tax=Staphylococcus pasteuri TaxID=45972 RepID=UPI0012B98C9D|nr:CDP-glycerol glycerophosphotransferase family protein [Staphylococcus pasteuri]MCD9067386.1 CDP-glycerol glycerophosphotransferase family protein [Staphylococcus pasteuri]